VCNALLLHQRLTILRHRPGTGPSYHSIGRNDICTYLRHKLSTWRHLTHTCPSHTRRPVVASLPPSLTSGHSHKANAPNSRSWARGRGASERLADSITLALRIDDAGKKLSGKFIQSLGLHKSKADAMQLLSGYETSRS
jgi:hypothetical protein